MDAVRLVDTVGAWSVEWTQLANGVLADDSVVVVGSAFHDV